MTEARGCGLEGPPERKVLHQVGYKYIKGSRFPGRMTVNECPEGIARMYGPAVAQADMALNYGLPDSKPYNQQDARLMQLVEEVRRLRQEE